MKRTGKILRSAKLRVVSPARSQVEAVRLLPASHLQPIVRRQLRIKRERLPDVVAGAESVVDRPEVEPREIDGVESERIHVPDGVLQREMGPGAFPELVGIVVDEPGRVELAWRAPSSCEESAPSRIRPALRRGIVAALRETLDGHDTAADVRLDGRYRSVRGAVVEEVDLDALIDEVADDVFDDVGFVVRGDDGDNGEVCRHGQ